jgi:hypothetical protein
MEEIMRKPLLAIIAGLLVSHLAFADDATCESKAADKKLAGAAKNSFIKKCEKDSKLDNAKKDCDAKAADKKLAGAAKNSFTKKCVNDAIK